MKLARARIIPFRLALRGPLATAHGVITARQGWLLQLQSRAGISGWGEASPLPGFGLEAATACPRALAALVEDLLGRDLDDLAGLLDRAELLAPGAPSARAALDCALHDLTARSAGRTVAELLADRWLAPVGPARAAPVRRQLPISALLAGGDVDQWRPAAERLAGEGYRVFKLKLGRAGLDRELAGVRALAACLSGAQRLRLDVNGAWTEAQALQALECLAHAPVEWLEQPLPAGALTAMARLRARRLLPLAADEAVSDPRQAQRVIEARAADWLVIKPAAVGGLRAACRIALAAAGAGLGCAVTSFLDSAIGVASAFHLAAALPPGQPAAGLGTSGLLRHDVCLPLPARGGHMFMASAPGLGLEPDVAQLDCTGRIVEWRA